MKGANAPQEVPGMLVGSLGIVGCLSQSLA